MFSLQHFQQTFVHSFTPFTAILYISTKLYFIFRKMSTMHDELKQTLKKIKLSHYLDALIQLGAAETADLMQLNDDNIKTLGLKRLEINRFDRWKQTQTKHVVITPYSHIDDTGSTYGASGDNRDIIAEDLAARAAIKNPSLISSLPIPSEESHKFRVAIIGDSGVGKTSLCDRLQHKEHEPTHPTISIGSFVLEEHISGFGDAKILFMDTCKAKSEKKCHCHRLSFRDSLLIS